MTEHTEYSIDGMTNGMNDTSSMSSNQPDKVVPQETKSAAENGTQMHLALIIGLSFLALVMTLVIALVVTNKVNRDRRKKRDQHKRKSSTQSSNSDIMTSQQHDYPAADLVRGYKHTYPESDLVKAPVNAPDVNSGIGINVTTNDLFAPIQSETLVEAPVLSSASAFFTEPSRNPESQVTH